MSKLIGQIGLKVLGAEKVRKTLLDDNWKFKKAGSSLMRRLGEWFSGIGKHVSKEFNTQYGLRYETDHRKLGNYHAEMIIEIWLKGELKKEDMDKVFVEKILGDYREIQVTPAPQEVKVEEKPKEVIVQNAIVKDTIERPAVNKKACCNIF